MLDSFMVNIKSSASDITLIGYTYIGLDYSKAECFYMVCLKNIPTKVWF